MNGLNIDLTGIFWLAAVGAVSIAIAVLVGVPLIGWWLYNHVSIAW